VIEELIFVVEAALQQAAGIHVNGKDDEAMHMGG
jgi:hypothetical protein